VTLLLPNIYIIKQSIQIKTSETKKRLIQEKLIEIKQNMKNSNVEYDAMRCDAIRYDIYFRTDLRTHYWTKLFIQVEYNM
jgi:hypothetical protein